MLKKIDIQTTAIMQQDFDEIVKVLKQAENTITSLKDERPTSVKFWLTINAERK